MNERSAASGRLGGGRRPRWIGPPTSEALVGRALLTAERFPPRCFPPLLLLLLVPYCGYISGDLRADDGTATLVNRPIAAEQPKTNDESLSSSSMADETLNEQGEKELGQKQRQ